MSPEQRAKLEAAPKEQRPDLLARFFAFIKRITTEEDTGAASPEKEPSLSDYGAALHSLGAAAVGGAASAASAASGVLKRRKSVAAAKAPEKAEKAPEAKAESPKAAAAEPKAEAKAAPTLKPGTTMYGTLGSRPVVVGANGGFYVLSSSGNWNPVSKEDRKKVVKG